MAASHDQYHDGDGDGRGRESRARNLGVDAGLCQFLKATFGPVIGATGSDSERGQTPAARLR
jgi:hypothetical protein